MGIDYLALFRSSTTDETVDRALSGIETVLSGERDYYEQEYLRPTPYVFRWFRMTVRSWRQQDTNAIIFHRDITAEKLGRASSPTVEQEFRALADSAPAMIWMSGPDKAVYFREPAMAGVHRWAAGGATGGGLGPVRCIPRIAMHFLRRSTPPLSRECESSAHEYRLRHNDGGYRWVRDSGSPRFDAHAPVFWVHGLGVGPERTKAR